MWCTFDALWTVECKQDAVTGRTNQKPSYKSLRFGFGRISAAGCVRFLFTSRLELNWMFVAFKPAVLPMAIIYCNNNACEINGMVAVVFVTNYTCSMWLVVTNSACKLNGCNQKQLFNINSMSWSGMHSKLHKEPSTDTYLNHKNHQNKKKPQKIPKQLIPDI